ncbi:hypothetical protein F2P81_025679 [Scophthalmus maximus]|uniref:Uncharacterized protein n=1 Tax=Scophthalmus maximus TaxID=52904 RepID=A0A6A4RPS0_SCOMX|nr:hypothetical protein F2P81_025679 [Scophthalmus maximus]
MKATSLVDSCRQMFEAEIRHSIKLNGEEQKRKFNVSVSLCGTTKLFTLKTQEKRFHGIIFYPFCGRVVQLLHCPTPRRFVIYGPKLLSALLSYSKKTAGATKVELSSESSSGSEGEEEQSTRRTESNMDLPAQYLQIQKLVKYLKVRDRHCDVHAPLLVSHT